MEVSDSVISDYPDSYYQFTLPAASYVTINTKPETADGSTLAWNVNVYNDSLNNLLSYSFNGTSPAGATQQIGLPAGTYYVRINTGYSSLYGVPYNLTVSASIDTISEQEPNDSTVAATPITLSTMYTGNIQSTSNNPSDADYYTFTLPDASYVTINTKPETADGSTLAWNVNVYNDSLNNLLSYSFNGTSPAGATQQVGLPAGTYYVKINTGYSSLYGVPYNLTVTGSNNIFEQEPNDSTATATPLTLSAMYTGNIQSTANSSSDADYFEFTLSDASYVTINTKPETADGSTLAWNVNVYNGALNNLLSFSFDGTSPDGASQQIGLPAGTYYIKINTGYSSLYGVAYNLTASASIDTISEQEPNNSTAAATPLTLSAMYTGNIQSTTNNLSDADYYEFTLSDASNVTINTKPETADGGTLSWNVNVYNDSLTNILSYSFNGTSPAGATQQVGLPAGTYYVKINTGYSSLYGVAYNLTASASSDTISEQEPNNSTAAATPLSLSTMHTGNIQSTTNNLSDADYYTFTLPAASEVTINTKPETADGSTLAWNVTVYNESLTDLLSYSFNGTSPAGAIQQVALPAGTYYVKISTGYSSLYGVPYILAIADSWKWDCSGSDGSSTSTCIAAFDKGSPTLSISTLGDGGITNNATLNISGTVFAANGIESITVNDNLITVSADGTFTYPVVLLTGANSITTNVVDMLGNSSIDTRIIYFDQTAPKLIISAPADNSNTAQPVASCSGTIDETSTVEVTVNNTTSSNASITGDVFNADVTLNSGLNTISITVTDLAGNKSSAVRTVTYDSGTLSLAITSPNQDITTAQSSMTISGMVGDSAANATVAISFNGQTLTPPLFGGTFDQLLTFPGTGIWPVTATAFDEAGNTSSVTRNIVYSLPSNGSCGTSNGATFTDVPVTNLCFDGTASTVTGNGPWNWSCDGIDGGTADSCSASSTTSALSQFTVTPATGSGFAISPSTPQTVNTNDMVSFTVSPTSGYGVVSVSGCEGSFGDDGTFTTGSITANCMVSVTAVARTATSAGASEPKNSDALKVLQAVTGLIALTPTEQICYDVAPLGSDGLPSGNGVLDAADVILILRRSINIGTW